MNYRIAFLCISACCLTSPLFAQTTDFNVVPAKLKEMAGNVLPALPHNISREEKARVDKLNENGRTALDEERFADAASSFKEYRKGLQVFYKIEPNKGYLEEIQKAFLNEIDAWIDGNTPEQARLTLDEFKRWLDVNPSLKTDDLSKLKIPFCEGKIAVLNRRVDADKYFTPIAKVLPGNDKIDQFNFWYYYGIAWELKQDYAKAIPCFQKASKSEHKNLKRISMQQTVFCLILNKQFDKAKKALADFNELKIEGKNDLILATYRLLDYFLFLKSGQGNEPEKDAADESLMQGAREEFQYGLQFLIADELLRRGEFERAYRIYVFLYVNAKVNPARKIEFIQRMVEVLNKAGNEKMAVDLIHENFGDYLKESVPVAYRESVAKICLRADYDDVHPGPKDTLSLYESIFSSKRDSAILRRALEILATKNVREVRVEEFIRAFYGDKEKHGPDADFMRGYYYELVKNTGRAAKCYSNAGDAYSKKSMKTQAIQAYSKAIDLYSKMNDLETLKRLCAVLLKLNPQDKTFFLYVNLLTPEKTESEIHKMFDAYIAKQQNIFLKNKALFENGKLYFKNRKNRDAKTQFDKICDNDDKDWVPVAAYNALLCSFEIFADAESDIDSYFKKILQGDYPNSPYTGFAMLDLMSHYIKKDKFDKVDEYFTQLDAWYKDKKASDNPQVSNIMISALLLKANALFEKQQYDEADKFLKDNESNFQTIDNCTLVYYTWGKILKEKKDYSEAQKKFNEVLKKQPDCSGELAQAAAGSEGDCLYAMERYAEARSRYQSFLLLKDTNGKEVILPKYKAMTMFKAALCMELDNTKVEVEKTNENSGQGTANPVANGEKVSAQGNSVPQNPSSDGTAASAQTDSPVQPSQAVSKEAKAPNWKIAAGEYLDIIELHDDTRDLKNHPYDIFWTMKAFERLRGIIEKHSGESACVDIMRETRENADKLQRAGIYKQDLKWLIEQIEKIKIRVEKDNQQKNDNSLSESTGV